MESKGVEESGESLAELFEKLPAKTAKRMLKIIGEIRVLVTLREIRFLYPPLGLVKTIGAPLAHCTCC
jgi:hypothetical protein